MAHKCEKDEGMSIPEDLRDLVSRSSTQAQDELTTQVCPDKSYEEIFVMTAEERQVLCFTPLMARLKSMDDVDAAILLGRRMATLQIEMTLGKGAMSLDKDKPRVMAKNSTRREALAMVHRMSEQARKIAEQYGVKVELINGFFMGMKLIWSGDE